jgi:cytoskeletal protein RodZ
VVENLFSVYNCQESFKRVFMNETMQKLGGMFKEKRQEMHLSLKEVENATSIRVNYLQAIEEGQLDKFLTAIYALGFVKQYASFLGFDGEKILRENEETLRLPAQKQDFAYGIGTLDIRNGSKNQAKWLPNFLWVGISLISLVVLWYFAKFLKFF